MKNKRQARIIDLITKYSIETQDDMMKRLRDEGFAVTQATVSRDLRELQLTKSLDANGNYRYVSNAMKTSHGHNVKFSDAIVDSIIDIKYSMNNIVIKTYPGMAQAIASGIDVMNIENILGCVAGDDTIIVVTSDVESSKNISETLIARMKEFKKS